MNKSAALGSIIFIVFTCFALSADAATPDASCIKIKVQGDASTYNPYLPGWRTGGSQTATGGTYDANSWSAALQLDIAKQVGCGYGSGKTCNAVVETTDGKAAVLMINDNGPLVPGRVIDLNEKAMRYLSGERYGNNSGVLRNVTVTVLCMADGQFLGPVNDAERQTWVSKTFTVPTTQAPTGGFGPTGMFGPYQGPSPYINSQSYGYMGGMMPIGASQGAYGYSYAQQPYQQYQPYSQPYTNTSSNPSASPQQSSGQSIANILVQPKTVTRGQVILVSWTSVNMVKDSCKVTFQGQDYASGSEGTKPFKTVSSDTGSLTFTLTCTDATGKQSVSSASSAVQ